MKRNIFTSKTLVIIVLSTFIFTAIYVIIKIALAPVSAPHNYGVRRVKSDYIILFLECIFGAFAILLPGILKKKWNFYIPSKMVIVYAVFLYCAIYLGDIQSFYYRVPNWDTILHTFSGAMLGAFGFSFISILNKEDSVPINLSPVFVSVFTFCFAVTLGVLWEIYEFTGDVILNSNMQRYVQVSGIPLSGQAALLDTMKDLIVDTLGALVMSVLGYISLRYKKGWLEKLQLRFNKVK